MITSSNSPVTEFMVTQVQAPVYDHYSTVGELICDSVIVSGCSFSNLTYNQWLSGDVLIYPLGDMLIDPIDASYTILYKDYTLLLYPPEAHYYSARSLYKFPSEITIGDTY